MFMAEEEAMTVENKLLEELYDCFYVRPKFDELEREVEANINYLKERADVVLSYIDEGMCFDDIAAAVITCMNIKIGNRYIFGDIHAMIMPYVQYLEETGKIEGRYEDGYIRYSVVENHEG